MPAAAALAGAKPARCSSAPGPLFFGHEREPTFRQAPRVRCGQKATSSIHPASSALPSKAKIGTRGRVRFGRGLASRELALAVARKLAVIMHTMLKTGALFNPNDARELYVTPADLEGLVRQGSQGANELPYTLTALGIDETALWRAEPALLHDMERVCLFCTHKRSVPSGARGRNCANNYVEYCENADTIDTLRFKSCHCSVTSSQTTFH